MGYQLKYYKEIHQKNGEYIRLEIHKSYPSGSPAIHAVEIADVITQLALDIQGQDNEIDNPIIKTSLVIGFVDAPELSDVKKCGNWEEFYTANAQEWKVLLRLIGKAGERDLVLWGGYITPDSYTETLRHRGIVTIIARDNIGQLQDFDFDAVGNSEGMITPRDIIQQAMQKINLPMFLDFTGEGGEATQFPQGDGVSALDTYVNLSAFEDCTWYDALTDVLYSFGIVMRYVNGFITVCPIRRIPEQYKESIEDVKRERPTFMAYATRELSPAVKYIEEKVVYEYEDKVARKNVQEGDFSGVTSSVAMYYKDNVTGREYSKSIPVNPLSNTSVEVWGWGNDLGSTLFFNPHGIVNYNIDEDRINDTYLAVSTKAMSSWHSMYIKTQNISLNISIGELISYTPNPEQISLYIHEGVVSSIEFQLRLVIDGNTYYYNGSGWGDDSSLNFTKTIEENACKIDVKFDTLAVSGDALLTLYIKKVSLSKTTSLSLSDGVYVGIKEVSVSLLEGQSYRSENVVKTVYDENNNIKLNRSPKFGNTFDKIPLPGLLKNGIFKKNGNYYDRIEGWRWPRGRGTQLPVLIHQQILCYYSKPNNLISGTIVNTDVGDNARIWEWKGKEHILMSGSYNFLTGNIDNAVLREFIRYDDMW